MEPGKIKDVIMSVVTRAINSASLTRVCCVDYRIYLLSEIFDDLMCKVESQSLTHVAVTIERKFKDEPVSVSCSFSPNHPNVNYLVDGLIAEFKKIFLLKMGLD